MKVLKENKKLEVICKLTRLIELNTKILVFFILWFNTKFDLHKSKIKNMKTKFTQIGVLILSVYFVGVSYGQWVTVSAGMNLSDLKFFYPKEETSFSDDTAYNYGASTGIKIGAEYTHSINYNLGINAGLYFSQRRIQDSDDEETFSHKNQSTFNYLAIPINAQYTIPLNGIRLHSRAGITPGIALSGKAKGYWKSKISTLEETWDNSINIGTEDAIKRMDFAYNLGIGVEFNNFSVNVNYLNSLVHIVDRTTRPDSKSTVKWSAWSFTLGYKLMGK